MLEQRGRTEGGAAARDAAAADGGDADGGGGGERRRRELERVTQLHLGGFVGARPPRGFERGGDDHRRLGGDAKHERVEQDGCERRERWHAVAADAAAAARAPAEEAERGGGARRGADVEDGSVAERAAEERRERAEEIRDGGDADEE